MFSEPRRPPGLREGRLQEDRPWLVAMRPPTGIARRPPLFGGGPEITRLGDPSRRQRAYHWGERACCAAAAVNADHRAPAGARGQEPEVANRRSVSSVSGDLAWEPGVLSRTRPPWTARYGAAALAVVLAFLLKAVLGPFLQEASTFLLLSAAVLAAAAYGGLGPGVFATLLGGVAGDYLFLPPVGTLVPPSAEHGLTTALFVAQGLAISVLGAWPRQGAGPKRARCGPRKIVGAWARARNASGCWWRAPRTSPSS